MIAVAVGLLGVAACGGGKASSSDKPSKSAQGSSGRHVELALAAGGSVQADLPGKPLGSVHTAVAGMDLEVWSLQRANKAVTVVIALHNTGPATLDSYVPVLQALDEQYAEANVASDIGLLDGVALKEYKTFAKVSAGGSITDCLCSETLGAGAPELKAGARTFYAAVVAAPPQATKTVTFVSGAGSVADLRISG